MNSNNNFSLALWDIMSLKRNWRIWLMLGWQDIKLRYRRSHIGPFWITISMAVMIYSMGFLYGHLFHMDLKVYFPFVASGMVVWTLMSTIMIESNDAFVESSGYIKQISLPFSIYVYRILTRNFIVFLHNILAIIPIFIYFEIHIGFLQILSALAGLVVIMACGLCFGISLAMLGSRFRDIKQVVVSLINVIFLVTPIMWMPTMLHGPMKLYATLNPFNDIIDLVRAPLMGGFPGTMQISVSAGILSFGALLMLFLMTRSRARIPFWV